MAKRRESKTSKLAGGKSVETIVHEDASRLNIPTAEYQSVMENEAKYDTRVAYARRNRDLDPQLMWRGKEEQDLSDLVVSAPPIYIQEKVHPKVLIDDLIKQTQDNQPPIERQLDLFSDFNGLPDTDAKTEFYQHEANWTNRMILGDSLQVMASLSDREGLRGKVQCVYLDPPYGIKFNSNFQWSTTNKDVKDGKADHITREPEQVKAYRDTWRDGIHSYLSYLRDRLTVAHELLCESGSIFVQIGDENVHRVRAILDEIFGDANFVNEIVYRTTGGLGSSFLSGTFDIILWYAKSRSHVKFRQLFLDKSDSAIDEAYRTTEEIESLVHAKKIPARTWRYDAKSYMTVSLTSSGSTVTCMYPWELEGKIFNPVKGMSWKPNKIGMTRMHKAGRLLATGSTMRWIYYKEDYPVTALTNSWWDGGGAVDKVYVVQTNSRIVQRCVLMSTDPGDLVLDPTCGSGTTATVAEQWGRRWITIDTSRVALALARARIMGAKYPYYLLADSTEGQQQEAEATRSEPSTTPTRGNIRHGFVYERVPHITLKSIANNTEIDVIWERFQEQLEPIRLQLNDALKQKWEEWEIPREAEENWTADARSLHRQCWDLRIKRQKEIDASISAKAEYEYLYDKPYEDKKKVRVAGPFTVESLSPHRSLIVGINDELIDPVKTGEPTGQAKDGADFVQMILENLKTAGVQQAHKEDKINFTSLVPWPGRFICAEGRYTETETSGTEKRAGIFIGPEFGTVSKPDLVAAAREAGDAGFDVLIACAFNYDAHSSEFGKLGRVQVLKARMNADLHMADDLKNTGKGNLFVIFGEPDIDIIEAGNDEIQVIVNGVDVFHPNTGEVRSDGADGIACWFIDSDYNEESFFVRQAYFLGANDPYKSLKTTLKAEIDADAWSSLNSDTSRPFSKPKSGRIAVKVINHLGDEVMKVFRVD
jgi:adenine-specific DNA-methyltransferase